VAPDPLKIIVLLGHTIELETEALTEGTPGSTDIVFAAVAVHTELMLPVIE
jgi:hypothetical protein